jgi:hypothetical protein
MAFPFFNCIGIKITAKCMEQLAKGIENHVFAASAYGVWMAWAMLALFNR